MKRMYSALIGSCLAILCTAAVGCTRGQTAQTTQTAQTAAAQYAKVRDNFLAQQSYAFYGSTKLLAGETANGNVVSFSGQKNGNDTFLNVKLSFPDQKRVDSMSLLSKSRQLYARFDDKEAWQPVDKRDRALEQELANWHPDISFQQMDEMKSRIIPLQDTNPSDNLEAFRVTLDSNKLKSWLARQMKSQVGGQVQSTHAPRLKLAMQLSDGEWADMVRGARIQAAQTRKQIDEIIDHMEVDAEYTVYYDRHRMLPTSLVMNIRSEYDLDDQRVHEYSRVETFLQDYGREKPLPHP
ncbi:hypothetical protein G3578_19200 [Brevibacillus sp. SYP-B805]|uniref:hypothetical protein n=1 Tax=Brevibacillus sp. SYP-B805 TaxID=1578199 RepID=UPI0013EC46BB|nr:hypothetical protein [Brevibacillus sp. SYP-B805]NGQ97269.1 hypothetical protein [Brevibacillus sp. SYP-B805]